MCSPGPLVCCIVNYGLQDAPLSLRCLHLSAAQKLDRPFSVTPQMESDFVFAAAAYQALGLQVA